MSQSYSFTIIGNPEDGFTSAEIHISDNQYIGRIFELSDGWYLNLNDFENLKDPSFQKILNEAKSELQHYVNRKGGEFPAEMTVGAISLWLLQRDDGKGFSLQQ